MPLQPFTGGAGWGGGGFGTPLMSTRPAWQGDEQYAHDKAGNLTGLRRHHCYRPNQPLPLGAKGDNWTYQYAAGTNRLVSLKTGGVVQGGFTYGATGALASDSRRGVAVAQAELGGLPTRLTVGGVQVAHVYGAGGRVHKSAGGGQGEYYLRGAGGGVLAVHREADSVWVVQLHGLGPVAEVELPDPVRDSTAGDTLGGGGGVNRVARPRGAAVRVLLRQALAVAGVAALEGLLPEAAPPGGEGGDGRGAAGLVRVPAVRALLWPGLAGLLEGGGGRPPKGAGQPPAQRRMDADSTWLPVLKFLVMDHLGNVRVAYRAWRDSASCAPRTALASLMDYTPHGRLLRAWAAPGAGAERWQSTLHERDAETGWDHRGARLYDADYGRFISVDPLAGLYPGWSPYAYVLGDPVALTDPTGMYAEGGGRGKDGDYMLGSVEISARRMSAWERGKYRHSAQAISTEDGNALRSFATGFVDRAAQVAFPVYGVYKGGESMLGWAGSSIASGTRILEGEGGFWDYVGVFGGVSTLDAYKGMYGFGTGLAAGDAASYQQLGAMGYDMLLSAGTGMAGKPAATSSKPGWMSGETVLGSDNATLQNAANLVPEPGVHQLLVHGDALNFFVNGATVTPKSMARTMLESGYVRGTPVRLISCQTGVWADGAAYQLSRYLKSAVTAPTDLIQVLKTGEYLIHNDGFFITFDNTKMIFHRP